MGTYSADGFLDFPFSEFQMLRLYSVVLLVGTVLALAGCRAESAEVSRESRVPVASPVAASPRAVTPPVTAVEPGEAAGQSPVGTPAGMSAPAEALAPAPAPTPASADTLDPRSAEAILARVETTYDAARSFQADFVQQLTVPLLGSTQTSRGEIYQRKPDRFLMKFTDPAGDVLVADGQFFWMYYPSSDPTQVIRASMTEGAEQADLQRQFLSNASERYVVTLAGEENVEGRPAHVLTLVPKTSSQYRLIKVWVDKQDHLVRRFEMTEENGSVRRLDLRDIRLNTTLPDDLFRFTPPAGAQVFTQ